MKGIKGMRLGLVGAAAIAVVLVGGLLLSSQALAQSDSVGIHDGSAAPGEEGSVDLGAHDIGEPGLGAWTLDISYDTDVITAVDCGPEQGGVCNPEFGDGVVRVTGASAGGLEGDTLLASITFECADDEGTSDLEIAVSVFADATIGDPQDIDMLTVSDGSFECAEEDEEEPPVVVGPSTGTGPTEGQSLSWLVAVLAGAGAVGLAAGYGALRLRTRQS